MYQPSVKSFYKTNHFTYIKHTYTNIRHNFFEELAPSILPLLKKHIRLGHAGIITHSIYRYQIKEKKKKKGMDRHGERCKKRKWQTFSSTGQAGAIFNQRNTEAVSKATAETLGRHGLSQAPRLYLNLYHTEIKAQHTHLPCSLASSSSWRKASFFSFILRCFSRRSSSARSFTYWSNTCLRSLEVRSK